MNNQNLIDLIKKLNQNLQKQYQYKLDPIHSTKAKVKSKVLIEFLGYNDSIHNDVSWIPNNLIPKMILNEQLHKIVNWVNDKLFLLSLTCLLNNRNSLQNTEDVRMRIAVNLIDKSKDLTIEEKNEIINSLHLVYRERRRVVGNYYEIEIAKLPFLGYGHWVAHNPLIDCL